MRNNTAVYLESFVGPEMKNGALLASASKAITWKALTEVLTTIRGFGDHFGSGFDTEPLCGFQFTLNVS